MRVPEREIEKMSNNMEKIRTEQRIDKSTPSEKDWTISWIYLSFRKRE